MKFEKDHRDPDESRLTDVPQFSDRLPIAPARVAVLKANYRQAWLYFLLILCMIVAWGIPIRYAIVRWLAFRPASAAQRDAYEFVALAYEGISKNPREVSPERFREQFAAIRKAGYAPITLRDVKALYEEGQPLPRKAILMTFDNSRKSSYFDARSVLQRAGWSAVMFLWTKPILDEDPASLRWPYIRSMIRSGAWEAGAQSHLGFERILADSEGNLRNFLTTPQWFPDEMRYESPEAFSQRITADHEYSREIIAREIGAPPAAFAFPYGDFGQYDERAILTRRLNLDLIAQFYDLGFIHGNAALNTRYSDPRRLNRLLVKPDWTGHDLLQRLEHAWPRTEGYSSGEALNDPLAWLTDWGGFELRGERARLFAPDAITGAKVWLNGSDLYGDFHGRFRLRIEDGQVGFFFRASSDGESYLYLGLGRGGDVWLRQKHAGMQPFTLGSGRYTPDEQGYIDLHVFLRDRVFFATVGGQPVFPEIISTRGEIRPGMVGCSVWHPIRGTARAELSGLEIDPFATSILTWAPIASREPALAYWLSRNAFRHTHLAPPWLRVASRGQTEQFGWEPALFKTFAHIYRMKFTPEIVLDNLEIYEAGLTDRLAALAAQLGADGVYCNLAELKGAPPLARITAWIQNFSRSLEDQGLSLTVRLPPSLEKDTTLAALFQGLPSLKIAVDPETTTLEKGLDPHLRRVVETTAADIDRRRVFDLHHELEGADATLDEWSTEVRGKLLRQEGHDAYQAGQFDRAIEIWSRWSELEPDNAEPLSLIGDVYLRRGDYATAIDRYRASLDESPGQINLVVRVARLLDQHAGRSQEARDMLDLYADLFPDNSDIALARAEWLIRNKQPGQAGEIVRQIITRHPDDLAALALLHGLLRTPAERVANIDAIKRVGARPGMQPHLAQAIRDRDLLTWPESWRLMDFIENAAAHEPEGPQKQIYENLLPRKTVVTEAFSGLGRLSDNWIVTAEEEEEDQTGPLVLSATPTQTEASLRLAGSDAMHNGFIEALIEDARGFFWLYARRGEGSMLRFGFDQTGRMYLQIWHQGRMLANQSRFWTKPAGSVRIRLELRGDGAFGFIDGKPAFGAPVPIPRAMGLGWWGIAPWAPQFGVAQVVVREVVGGPTPVKIGVFRPRDRDWTDDQYLEQIKPWTHELAAIAPQWFVQELDGRIRTEYREEYPNLRILARYYQMRLLPGIRSVSPRTLDIPELITLAAEANVDGFTLLFSRMPDADWFDRAELALLGSPVSLIAIRLDEEENIAEVREICPHVGLFPGSRHIRAIPLRPATEITVPPEAATGTDAVETPKPANEIILF